MSGDEAAFMFESDIDKSTIAAFVILDGPHDPNAVEEYHRQFLETQKRVPFFRLTCVPEKILGYYYWRETHDFKMEEHWRLLDGVDPDRTYSEREVLQLYGDRRHNVSFPKDKPLWEVLYVPRFAFDDDIGKTGAVEKSCYIMRMNHSISDGVNFSRFMGRLVAPSL